jgi:predicted metal-dependent hydrolase
MGIIATIMNTATGQPIQKMSFGRMPKRWASFNLATGELVTAERIDVGKPEPGKFAAPVSVWVTLKTDE